MNRRTFDIGIVIPLQEEFRYVVEIAPILESISHNGTFFYRLDFGETSALCCLISQMGPLPALQGASRLLEFADVKLMVLLGLGGALDDDVAVGDVVVAAEINEFQANSKAVSTDEGYEVRYSGRHWPLDFRLREAINHFEFSGHAAFSGWQAQTSSDYAKLDITSKETVCSAPPSLHLGPIASGTVVAASTAFVSELKRINRKFLAIDMEAAGVAPAAAERIHPLPFLVVRGMSDHSNENKRALDQQGRGSWRRYCVRNAASLLRHLLKWDGFLNAAGVRTTPSISREEALAGDWIGMLKSETGGSWIAGVTLGLYTHGPYAISDHAVVPMDLSRLRISDPRVDKFLTAVENQWDKLLAGGDSRQTAQKVAHLLDAFRKELNSVQADALLQDFDQVVAEILCPQDQDEEVESLLLESDRLEEEVGPEAAIELLRGFSATKPRLRARYVDVLASADKWGEIRSILAAVDPLRLSRSELEHGIFAHLKADASEAATAMLKCYRERYNDKAAKLYSRELRQSFPLIGSEGFGEEK